MNYVSWYLFFSFKDTREIGKLSKYLLANINEFINVIVYGEHGEYFIIYNSTMLLFPIVSVMNISGPTYLGLCANHCVGAIDCGYAAVTRAVSQHW